MKNEVKNKSVAFIVLVSVYTGESLRPLRQASCFAYFIYILSAQTEFLYDLKSSTHCLAQYASLLR